MTKALTCEPLSVQIPDTKGNNAMDLDDVETLVFKDRRLTG